MVLEKLIKINFFLILILPLALISGPLIPDLIVIISCILICLYFKTYHLKLSNNRIILHYLFMDSFSN